MDFSRHLERQRAILCERQDATVPLLCAIERCTKLKTIPKEPPSLAPTVHHSILHHSPPYTPSARCPPTLADIAIAACHFATSSISIPFSCASFRIDWNFGPVQESCHRNVPLLPPASLYPLSNVQIRSLTWIVAGTRRSRC